MRAAVGSFAATYAEEFGQAPGTYSVEGLRRRNDSAPGESTWRRHPPALLDFVKNYDGRDWRASTAWTDQVSDVELVWIYKVQ